MQEPITRYKRGSHHSSCSRHVVDNNDTFSISDRSMNKSMLVGHEAGGDTDTANTALEGIDMKIIKPIFSESEVEADLLANSHFQLIEANIQNILQKFFTNVQDLELYRNKFNDLIAKKHTREEMDAFVNEVMAHLKETESRQNIDHGKYCGSCTGDCFCGQYPSETHSGNQDMSIVAYKNMNFNSDTSEGGSNKIDLQFTKDRRTLQIKGFPRKTLSSHLSELILRTSFDIDITEAASAENVPKLEAKRIELENINADDDSDKSERDIPIKVSHPKRNIHTDEDFPCRRHDESDSFLSKLCTYICKKFRRLR